MARKVGRTLLPRAVKPAAAGRSQASALRGAGLAGLPTRMFSISTCFFLMNLWEELGGGMARIELFDPRLNAGAYISKDLARLGNASLSRGFQCVQQGRASTRCT